MKNSSSLTKLFSLMILVHPLLTSCGSDSKSDPAPTVVYGTIKLTPVQGDDAGTYELTGLTQCARNADTGRVDVVMSQGAGKPSLTVAIKDYSASAKTYTCAQAADNKTSTTDVGGKFDSCMVATTVLSKSTATSLNGYAMHREAITVKPFTYAGSCSIQVTEASPSIKGTVSCTKMVQTQLEGAARNPIDTGITADLTAEFKCTFQ
ncbi:MAG TPA: hypothetical protein VE954_17680 [Oligoflexus sp.]|uniref:hypothetical protein n=1 Tax=Oligoflexus sp. TaxID=1971216 RepID=UPI002D237057|nr:hypothetical protein [Oligoflexus sp.]HYX34931.1 hypothetical protein [Oligoflexus sp.]